ncbi:MAG TPA: valine--tRNA ligase [Candidatus Magasanikbacteria bacterium]|nr:valine--tRNA ligase [Candidatus Magasanikbacteria bacterium]
MRELAKAYEPKQFEDNVYKKWEDSGFFNPDVCVQKGVCKKNAKPYSIVLPPPNVTGTLHMGHAAMLAIEDVLVRYHRMKGDKTLWLPGTDHAAIATQTKVEKILMEKGIKEPKVELGREKFLAEVDRFAQQSHDTIVNQSKKMGSSLDWNREAFTLDEKRNLAVRTVFSKMYKDKLIYRGYRIVNWCPRCKSTLADDEVEYKEQSAKFYTFKYSADFPIVISTTRPETKLGDTAIAVNPDDDRYKQYIGQTFEVKNFAGGNDLKIKIIADTAVDMSFGTGALGVTPAHSKVDYDMAIKNDLPIIKIIDEDGKMTAQAGKEYVGLTVKEARKKVVENLIASGLMIEEKDIPNNLSVCYRCGTPIEPLPSNQWFVAVNKKFKFKGKNIKGINVGDEVTLKELMLKVVENKQIEIIPDRFEKVYFSWINNLNDWCISRQIWYGHRIPVWYKDKKIKVDVEAPKEEGWVQDPDSLDTWFSSGIWTFSTLGWPEKTADFKNFHPTSVLETGYDIIFFWVARMILMTTYALGDIPFEKVYLHGMVRDDQGRKMSKSLGNVIDPLVMIEKFGTDATRLSLLLGTTPGNDIKLSEEKIAGFRNFTNKLWNISRFMLLNVPEPKKDIKAPKGKTEADKWILGKLDKITTEITVNLENYNFAYSGELLRDFTWGDLADWYLEVAKIEGDKAEILNYILNTLLKLWHPFMPYVTETIWQEVYGENEMLMVVSWPKLKIKEIPNSFETIKNIVSSIRAVRAENKIEPAKKIKAVISAGEQKKLLSKNLEIIKGLGRLEELNVKNTIKKPKNYVGFVESGTEVYLDVMGDIDVEKEKVRLNKEIEETENYLVSLQRKLNNADFVAHAPAVVVEKEKTKMQETEEKLNKLKNQLKNIV